MPYVKTEWATGDLLSAEGLNNIEDGVYNAVNTAEGTSQRVANMNMYINEDMELVVEF